MGDLTPTEVSIVQQWNNPAFEEALDDIAKCQFGLGSGLTTDQRLRLERLIILFPGPPPPSTAGKARQHYNREEVWNAVWRLLQLHPSLRSGNLNKIVSKLELLNSFNN
jgi:hypothetical protein